VIRFFLSIIPHGSNTATSVARANIFMQYHRSGARQSRGTLSARNSLLIAPRDQLACLAAPRGSPTNMSSGHLQGIAGRPTRGPDCTGWRSGESDRRPGPSTRPTPSRIGGASYPRRQWAGTRLCLLRRGGQAADLRRGTAHSRQHREAAGAMAYALQQGSRTAWPG
jgi:hypothetical protein